MNKKLDPLARLQSQAQERRFWQSRGSTHCVDWVKAKRLSPPNRKMSTTAISLALPQGFFDRIKVAANALDGPYQSLVKVWPAEKVDAK